MGWTRILGRAVFLSGFFNAYEFIKFFYDIIKICNTFFNCKSSSSFIWRSRFIYIGITFSFIVGTIFFLYCQWNGDHITRLFTTDYEVIKNAALYLKSYSMDCILVSFIFCMNSFFSGCDHSLFPMIHSFIATFLIRIPGSYFISRISGVTLYELGMAAPAATFISIVMCFVYMFSGKWKDNKIIY